MSAAVSLTLEQFTPAEAAQVTGVSPALQRDWRRRGLVVAKESAHARYSATELAELVLMREFSDEKLGPKLLRDIMMTSTLPLSDWVRALANEKMAAQGGVPAPLRGSAGDLPARYVVFSGTHVFRANDLNKAFSALADEYDRRFGFVCDLRKVAEQVIERLPRPVWRVVTHPLTRDHADG